MFSRADLIFLHAPSVYDFRKHSILYGPVSDLVPSTPVFEMYPIGFTTMAEYLERHGLRVRIVNLAVRMLNDDGFDPEALIKGLNPVAFGIDLHWLPHAHGALAVAEMVKKHHPDTPIIFGGFSSTYFHEELIRYPFVDYVIRGDSAEEPIHQLMAHLTGAPKAGALREVPNLTWKDRSGEVHVNDHTYRPETLDNVMLDYRYVVRAAIRDMDLRPGLQRIDAPVLVVTGRDDQSLPPAMGEAVAAGIRDAQVVELPFAHIPHFEAPERFVELLVGFCQPGAADREPTNRAS